MLPSATGGANWQGGSFDPETNMLYIFSTDARRRALGLVPPTGGDPTSDYVRGPARDPNAPAPAGGPDGGAAAGGERRGGGAAAGRGGGEGGGGGSTVQGLPLIKPPYGRITALDLNKGELVWQIAHGETPDNIKNHPALKG